MSTTSRTAADPKQKTSRLDQWSEQVIQTCDEQQEDFIKLADRCGDAICEYGRRQPGVAALAILGLGFFVGWKLKPW